MARVADYVIVQDDLFRISRGLEGLNNDSVQTFNFDMPSGFHAGSRTVLMFVMQLGISNVEYRIFLNDQFTLFHGVFSVDYRWHSFH